MTIATKQYVMVEPLAFTGVESRGFTYEVTSEQAVGLASEIRVGQIVMVPLGRRQSVGVVTAVDLPRPSFATRPITKLLELPPLPLHLVQLAAWLSEYYAASAGAAWQTMLPAGVNRQRRAARPSKEATFSLPRQDQRLSQQQQWALDQITNGSATSYLLQGVTGSGKTRLYLELAAAQLAQGRSTIILVPEISLTPQLIALFEASFPERVVAFHSGLGEAAKHRAWQRALASPTPLVAVGPRSALFLPLQQLGLIVVDECHETSYKQEQNPRYHAVVAGAKLAHLAGAKLILGSATPGLSEVYAAQAGRLELVRMDRRVSGRAAAQAHIIDLRDAVARGPNRWVSRPLLAALKKTLDEGRQSLLFINRRGSASSQICNHCGQVTLCPTCHLPLTFHADQVRLICHLCNFSMAPPAVCPICDHTELRFLGGGTKRIESEIATLLPSARLERLDKDSADPRLLPQLHARLHEGGIDILIGTQMIAKGLDLPRLDTVGVVDADTALHMPDFSSAERTFQLLTQVAGRAGRGDRPGQVFIQTRTPDHPVIQAAAGGEFDRFAAAELAQRQALGYPPFRFLLKLTVTAATQAAAIAAAEQMHEQLSRQPGLAIMGPAPAFHERAGGRYSWQLVIRAARRDHLTPIARTLPNNWRADLDPINLL